LKSTTPGCPFSAHSADDTTQINHVVVSPHGVVVVKTKNAKGWIFGSEPQATRTQKIYRNTYKFKTPLRQNHKHMEAP